MPKYVGSVRTMVVVGDRETEAYGNAEEATPVKTPLMVLASLPRKLSPGEKVTLPVSIFTMDKKIKKIKKKRQKIKKYMKSSEYIHYINLYYTGLY